MKFNKMYVYFLINQKLFFKHAIHREGLKDRKVSCGPVSNVTMLLS